MRSWASCAFLRVFNTGYWADLLLHDVDAKSVMAEHATALARACDLGYRSATAPWEDMHLTMMPVGDDEEESA